MSYKTGFYEGRLGIGLGSTMGMGDGNPRYSLDINGDIRLTGSIVNGDGQVLSLTPPEYTVEVGLDSNNSLIYNFEKQGTHTGSQNILIGKHAGTDLTTGSNNICLGKEAGGNLTSGTDNICIGRDTGMAALTTNSDAVYIGRRAGQHCSSQNIGIGFQAMQQQAGSNNIGIGYNSLKGGSSNTSRNGNVAIGYHAMPSTSSASYNCAIGWVAGQGVSTGQYNVFMGYQTGISHSSGDRCIFIGDRAGYSNTTADYNIGIGSLAIYGSCSATHNIAIGYECLYEGPNGNGTDNNDGGRYNVCMGYSCGKWISTGTYNTYIGYLAGQGTTHSTGYQNVFIGPSVGKVITTGYDNTCVGANSAYRLKTGAWNTCIGDYAGQYIDSGNYNVCVGQNAGQYIYYGSSNICIGTQTANAYSGAVQNMSNCICIGTYTGPKTTDTSNTCKLYIGTPSAQNGNTYRGEDGSFIYGYYNSTTLTSRYLRINGHLGIGCNPGTGYGLKVLSGDVYVANNFYVGSFQVDDQGGHSHISNIAGGGRLEFHTSSYNKIMVLHGTQNSGHIEFNGNVGIGTDSPDTKLHVNGGKLLITDGNGQPGGKILGGVSDNAHAIHFRVGEDGATDVLDFHEYGKIRFYTNGLLAAQTEKMCILSNGNVGIGTTSPEGGLHVANYYDHGTSQVGNRFINENSYNHLSSSWMHAADTNGRVYVGIRCNYGIWCKQLNYDSDSRIKIDITELSDNHALELVRNIPCREYHYKDITLREKDKTIGFIAQEVNKILPNAVIKRQNIIPNEMRKLENISWEEITDNSSNQYKLTTDLSDCSGIKYLFYVSKDVSGNDETKKEVVGNSDNTFTFEKKWNNVFCYGKEVDDFHTLDKAKLFALNFSATQELDRKVIALENENAELKTKNTDLENKIATLESELATIKQHLGI